MGTVSQLHGRTRAPAHRIESDEEAVEAARRLASGFAAGASDRDINRTLPHQEVEAVSLSGLLGISVPADYGGLDISNAVLAEIIAILSQADPSIAEVAEAHFYVLEALRSDGSEEQKAQFFARALAGDRFGSAQCDTLAGPAAADATRLTDDGPGHRINGRKLHASGIFFADWIAIFAFDRLGRLTMSLVPREAEGIQIIDDWDGFGQRTTGAGTVIAHNVYVGADAVVPHHKAFERPTTIGPVGEIGHAGIDLGIARAALAETLAYVRNRGQSANGCERGTADPLAVARIGEVSSRIEAAAAMIERAGRKIDVAQINPAEANIVEAAVAVAVARALSAEIAVGAADALFELAGTSSTRIGLNLDRHWRNARTHTLQESPRWKYHLVGSYYLNGTAPPNNGRN